MNLLITKGMASVMMETTIKDVNTMEEIVVGQMSTLIIVVNVNV